MKCQQSASNIVGTCYDGKHQIFKLILRYHIFPNFHHPHYSALDRTESGYTPILAKM